MERQSRQCRSYKNMRVLIGIDLDGVVIDHTRHFLRACKRAGHALKPWQVNSNVLSSFLPSDIRAKVKRSVYTRMRSGATVVPGALGALKRLADNAVVVSVQKEASAEKMLWPWLKRRGVLAVIPRSRIHVVRTRMAKLRRIKKLKPAAFIDDGLDVLEFVPKTTLPILFDPHGACRNRRLSSRRIVTARSWKGVLRRVRPVLA